MAVLLALTVGYGDLARGGITLGPILLVVGYCGLLPAAIWFAGSRHSPIPAADPRPSYLAAVLVSAAILALYLVTLAPTTAMWDASEYIAAAYVVGIPHPPGNPLFVLLGRVFALLPLGPSVAVRINVLAAVCSAAAAGFWFLAAERILQPWLVSRRRALAGAAAAALIGATAFTVWNQSVVNEKVYTISLLGIAATSWLMIRWLDETRGPRATRLLVLAAYLTGLGFANQMSAFLVGPAVLVAILTRRPRTLLQWRLVLACSVAIGAGITVFATQPIRAAYTPAISEGEPTACTEGQGFQVDCTFTRTTWERFEYNFNREQYGKPPLTVRQAPFTAQLHMWWFYFRWQWLRDPHLQQGGAQALLAAVFLGLGLLGGVAHYRHDRRTFWYIAPLMATLSLLLVFYMNFRYGASQSPELGDVVPREVRDRDYFFIWSFSAWGIWAALGLVALWQAVATRIGERGRGGPRVDGPQRGGRGWVVSAPVLAIALVPLITNWSTASRAGQTDARDFAHDLLASVEPYAILVVAGDNDSFPIWYAQEVEGVRRDVLVVTDILLNTDWHLRQVLRRRVDPYDPERGPAIYRSGEWHRPAGPPIRMTATEADSLAPLHPIPERMIFRKAGVAAVLDPANMPRDEQGTGYLSRGDVAVLRMIAEAWPERPVYFARTATSQARKLGLEPYLLTQGLVDKLVPGTPSDTAGVVRRPTGRYDVQRTRALWNEVYLGPRNFAERTDWIDRPSVGIPYLYAIVGHELATAEQALGNDAAAHATRAVATRIATGAHLDELLPMMDLP